MSALLNKLQTFLGSVRREYLTVNRRFNIIEASPGVQRYADCSHEVLPGGDVRDCFPELVGIEDILINIFEERQVSFELKGITRSQHGSLYFNFYIVNDSDDEIEGRLIIWLEDVTSKMVLEQKLVQAANEKSLLLTALSDAKDYADKIITSISDALLVTTASGSIKTVNQATIDLFGYGESELINQSLSMIVADTDLLLQSRQQCTLYQNCWRDAEVVCQTKTGESVIVAFSCSALQTDAQELPDFIYTGRDITERRRTQQRLAAQYATTCVLSESATVDDAIPRTLQALCESLGWELGELWTPDQYLGFISRDCSAAVLRCVNTWVRPSVIIPEFISIAWQTTFAPGVGLPGLVWASRSPYWISDVIKHPNFRRAETAEMAGMRGAFGFPILDAGAHPLVKPGINHESAIASPVSPVSPVLGVMTFFSREVQQPDPDLLQMMVAIGSQLGQFVKRKQAEAALRHQQEQTERLLLNILPEPVANQLKQVGAGLKLSPTNIAESFAEVTVLFADIVGFTQIAAALSPIQLVDLLNQIFSAFDQLTEQHGLEKIKTIGDAYMVVGGLPTRRADHAEAIAEMALDMQAEMARFNIHDMGRRDLPPLRLRIGIHSGPVVAGVIGCKKFNYDLWGDTVNTASRMESHGLPEQIQVTAATYELLQPQYLFERRGAVEVKGKGQMTTYLLSGRKMSP